MNDDIESNVYEFEKWLHNFSLYVAAAAFVGSFLAIRGMAQALEVIVGMGETLVTSASMATLFYFVVKVVMTYNLRPPIHGLKIIYRSAPIFEDDHIGIEPTPDEIVETQTISGPLAVLMAYAKDEHIKSTKWVNLYQHVSNEGAAFSRRALQSMVEHWFYTRRDGEDYHTFPELMIKMGAAQKTESGYTWSDDAAEVLNELLGQLNLTPPPRINMVQNAVYRGGTGGTSPVPVENGAGEVVFSSRGRQLRKVAISPNRKRTVYQ